MSSKDHIIGPFRTPPFYQPIIQGFRNMIERNGCKESFEKAVAAAHSTETEEMTHIKNFDDYCNFLNYLVLWILKENKDGTFVYIMLCTFYFVLDQESVVCYQSPIKSRAYPHEPLTELS